MSFDHPFGGVHGNQGCKASQSREAIIEAVHGQDHEKRPSHRWEAHSDPTLRWAEEEVNSRLRLGGLSAFEHLPRISSVLSALAITVLFPMPAQASAFEAKVVGVTDGDTVTVVTADHRQFKIRVAGIDAPEKKQAFGARAKQALSDCAFGQSAMIDGDKLDRYGRTVAKVIVRGTDCGLQQVRRGFAWHFKRYAKEQAPDDRIAYSSAEIEARDAKRGLWSDPVPIAPWDFRKKR